MKIKIFFLIATAFFVQNTFSQKKLPVSNDILNNVVEDNLKSDSIANEKNATISYKLILENGWSTGMQHYYSKSGNEMRTRYSWLGLSINAINNIAINNKILLGIGGGIEYRSYFGIPLELAGIYYVNFRYYFEKPDKIVIPMINAAVGGRMGKEFEGFFADHPWHLLKTKHGVYSTFGAGFKVKLFSLQGGVLFWTKGSNFFGLDAMVKLGLNF